MDFTLKTILRKLAIDEKMLVHIVSVALPLLLVFVIGMFIIRAVERGAMQRANKDDVGRIRQGARIVRYLFIAALAVIASFSFAGSWTGLGVSLGVVAAAMGFALQKPAASVAAWLTILLKRPFRIGDRIAIGSLAKGDVTELTLTHLYLAEVGRLGAEDISGRTIMLPNSVIFEQPLIRYGKAKDRILNEVEFTITYDSDLKKARALAESLALEIGGAKAEPHTRIKLGESGILIEVRFQAPVAEANRMSSDLAQEIVLACKQSKDVTLAFHRVDVALIK